MNSTQEKILYKKTDDILKSPFFIDKPVLEISVVLDCSLSEVVIRHAVTDTMMLLKKHDKKYTNVRLNVIKWQSDISIDSHVESMMGMIMKTSYELEMTENEVKDFGKLEDYLNKYHQRSKIVLMFTDGKFKIKNSQEVNAKLLPLLGRKIVVLRCDGDEIIVEDISDILTRLRMGDR